jgi:hypothetical protein
LEWVLTGGSNLDTFYGMLEQTFSEPITERILLLDGHGVKVPVQTNNYYYQQK